MYFNPLVTAWKNGKGTVFMKVAALALVLIVASAVVLLFANTLNSWVVGGLIGGLAALLISIPISLIIFSTFARRHDERLYAQMLLQQEEDLALYEERYRQEDEEGDVYDEEDEYGRVYEADAYYVAEEEEWQLPRGRRQPELRSLPPAGQSQASSRSTAKLRTADTSQNMTSSQASRRPAREFAYERGERGERTREFSALRQKQKTGHQRTARVPYTTQSLRSQQQAAARRAAKQEAAQGYSSTGSEQLSTGPIQRPTTTGHLPPRSIQRNPSPSTGPVRLNPETGQIVRNRQVDEQYSDEEATTGNLYSPLVRRAPYLYEDDPLHEELSQHIDKPIKRRASRYLSPDEE